MHMDIINLIASIVTIFTFVITMLTFVVTMLDNTKKTDWEKHKLSRRLASLGDQQFNAACNNRLAQLEDLTEEVRLLQAIRDGKDIPDIADMNTEPILLALYLKTLDDDTAREEAQVLVGEKQTQMQTIRTEIENDKAKGYFCDYTNVKRRMHTDEAIFVHELPLFYQWAHDLDESVLLNRFRRLNP